MIDNDLNQIYLECLKDQMIEESLGKSLLGAGIVGAGLLARSRINKSI